MPSGPASRRSVAGVARARNVRVGGGDVLQDRERASGVSAGVGGAGEERADEPFHRRPVVRVRAQPRGVCDEDELVVGGDAGTVEGDDRRLEPALLELDSLDVAVDAEHGVDPVCEQRRQQVVADATTFTSLRVSPAEASTVSRVA